mmetsp:Transcript_817/g.2689  ORF Transcript_817/g.2689 Transcript_817/m.2689 type:complete len:310 (+) Transcript_817:861-1790(+)
MLLGALLASAQPQCPGLPALLATLLASREGLCRTEPSLPVLPVSDHGSAVLSSLLASASGRLGKSSRLEPFVGAGAAMRGRPRTLTSTKPSALGLHCATCCREPSLPWTKIFALPWGSCPDAACTASIRNPQSSTRRRAPSLSWTKILAPSGVASVAVACGTGGGKGSGAAHCISVAVACGAGVGKGSGAAHCMSAGAMATCCGSTGMGASQAPPTAAWSIGTATTIPVVHCAIITAPCTAPADAASKHNCPQGVAPSKLCCATSPGALLGALESKACMGSLATVSMGGIGAAANATPQQRQTVWPQPP